MHGYIDSILVPLHLPPSGVLATGSSSSSSSGGPGSKGKGKAKDTNSNSTSDSSSPPKYDIVKSWSPQEADQVRQQVELAATLGYATIVLIISIPTTTNPSLLSFPTPLYADLDPRTSPQGTPGQVLQLWRLHVHDFGDHHIKAVAQKGQYGLSHTTSTLIPSTVSLLSITPLSLSSFSHIALSLSPASPFSPSLISLDPSLSPRLPFPLKRGLVHTLQRAGISIEIVLRGLTQADEPGSTPLQRRRNWISGAREIVRAMGGKAVVLGSWAKGCGEMRAPRDLINLCSLIGLDPTYAKDALSTNSKRAILKGLAMRQTYRGVLSNPSLVVTTTTTTSTATNESNDADDVCLESKKRRVEEDHALGVMGKEDEVGDEGSGGGVKRPRKK